MEPEKKRQRLEIKNCDRKTDIIESLLLKP